MNDNLHLKFFHRGRDFYGFLERAIGDAKEEVLVSTYSFAYDGIGKNFIELLCEKALQGVRVSLIYDALESKNLSPKVDNILRRAGVAVYPFRRWQQYLFYHPVSFLYRNHTRIYLIDRSWMSFGGMCVGDTYLDREDLNIALLIEEPSGVVELFEYLKKMAYKSEKDFSVGLPRLQFKLTSEMDALVGGPRRSEYGIYDWLLNRLATARKRVVMVTAFFFPSDKLMEALIDASRRGVEVEILTPLSTDKGKYDKFRALPLVGMLKEGIRWYGVPSYFHEKFCILDDDWLFGSANFDLIGLQRNYELNACGSGGVMLSELEKTATSLKRELLPIRDYPVLFIFRRTNHLIYKLLEKIFTARR